MTEVESMAEQLNTFMRNAETVGSLAEMAVFCLGDADTGDEELDKAIESLYRANEHAHRLVNKLALRYDLQMFQETLDD